MSKINSDFYIIQYAPNDEGIPHFMDKEWIPEIPEYAIHVGPPNAKTFLKKYTLKIKSYHTILMATISFMIIWYPISS